MINFDYKTVPADKSTAEKIRERICEFYGIDPAYDGGPQVVMDWDWFGGSPRTAIVWEGGPYEWTTEVDMRTAHDSDIWTEAATSWATSVWRDVRDVV